jgi:hypothetical protein
MRKKDVSKFFLVILLLADVGYSFFQHMNFPLDGDMGSIILFEDGYTQLLHDPFGWTVLTEGSLHSASNRFFAHLNMSVYFKTVPLLLHSFLDPINSVYIACGIAKTMIQVLITALLAMFVTGKKNLLDKDLLLAAVLITPLFQASGYNGPMGIIDKSITYTFFYALPMGLLLIFFLPFYKEYFFLEKVKFSIGKSILFLLLVLLLAFNGPLIPGVVAIVCPFYLVKKWREEYEKKIGLPFFKRAYEAVKAIPTSVLFYFSLFSLLCLYSLYIGSYNGENFTNTIPLWERYTLLPKGLFNLFHVKLGLPVLLLFILLNVFIIKKTTNNPEGQKIITLAKWILLFSVLYLLLLPLGGYRDYRPNIFRRDTIMPVVICMIFIYGLSTFYIIKTIRINYKKIYYTGVVFFILMFTIADEPIITDNYCEKDALKKLALSTQKITFLENDCPVVAWTKSEDYKMSITNARLIKYWGITKEERLYYQK